MKQQTLWMYPDKIYITSGGASANSLFFEDKFCHLPAERIASILQASELFFKYLNRFIEPMADIMHYKLNSTEWALLIRTKSEEKIKSAYFKQRVKSKRANRDKDQTEVNRMISEHFRMFLSNFAKEANRYLQRKGVLVMKRFDKYPINTESKYQQEFEKICDLKFCNYQQINKKYQPDVEDYDQEGFLVDIDGSPHELCSAVGVYDGKFTLGKLPISLELVRPNSNVLRNILNKSKITQNLQNNHPKKE